MLLVKIAYEYYPHTVVYMSTRPVSAYYLLGICLTDGITYCLLGK